MKVVDSKSPEILAQGVHLDRDIEMQFTQYMPIKLYGDAFHSSNLPSRVAFALPVIAAVESSVGFDIGDYVYLTVKHLWVPAGTEQNRPGWHIDGYDSDDINVVWFDSVPTEFADQEFYLSEDHAISLKEMELQVQAHHTHRGHPFTVYKLDNTVVHRCGVADRGMMRTFVKVSISKNMYNLQGNARNERLVYNWGTIPRSPERNHPHKEV